MLLKLLPQLIFEKYLGIVSSPCVRLKISWNVSSLDLAVKFVPWNVSSLYVRNKMSWNVSSLDFAVNFVPWNVSSLDARSLSLPP
jgi:hypothetical protein